MMDAKEWMFSDEMASYCPEHNEITFGFLKMHYCDHAVDLGNVNETWESQIERELHHVQRLQQETMRLLKIYQDKMS